MAVDRVSIGEKMIMYRISEVARLLDVSLATVYREIQDGRLRVTRIRNTIRVSKQELDRYLAEMTRRSYRQ